MALTRWDSALLILALSMVVTMMTAVHAEKSENDALSKTANAEREERCPSEREGTEEPEGDIDLCPQCADEPSAQNWCLCMNRLCDEGGVTDCCTSFDKSC